jgi:hypothetical protein
MSSNEILAPYIVTTIDNKKVLVRQRTRIDSLSDHLPLYDNVIFYQALTKVLAQPSSTQNDTGILPSTYPHLKSGKVVHYHRFGLMENLGLSVPNGYQDKITICLG